MWAIARARYVRRGMSVLCRRSIAVVTAASASARTAIPRTDQTVFALSPTESYVVDRGGFFATPGLYH